MAVFYKQPDPTGQVALVLGAGNIASIAPLDVLYKLIAEGQVCLLKMNPINEYLGKFMERVFAGLVQRVCADRLRCGQCWRIFMSTS